MSLRLGHDVYTIYGMQIETPVDPATLTMDDDFDLKGIIGQIVQLTEEKKLAESSATGSVETDDSESEESDDDGDGDGKNDPLGEEGNANEEDDSEEGD